MSFPRCPTGCDDDCEQACHEVHQVPWKRDHDPELCVGAIVEAARAAERARCAQIVHAKALTYDGMTRDRLLSVAGIIRERPS